MAGFCTGFVLNGGSSLPFTASCPIPNTFTQGVFFSAVIPVTGGMAPFTFGLAPGSGPLPAGLAFHTGGIISGTPTAVTNYTFTIRVTSATGAFVDVTCTLSSSAVRCPCQIKCPGGRAYQIFTGGCNCGCTCQS